MDIDAPQTIVPLEGSIGLIDDRRHMALSPLFERVIQSLFGRSGDGPEQQVDQKLIDDTIEMVVETVEPRVRHHSRYKQKLKPCVRETIAHLRSLGKAPLEPIVLARKAWSGDPRLNTFFATADDVQACLGRTSELRAFFADPANAGVEEAFALLGMKKKERQIFASRQDGDVLRHDVAQVSVSFSDHRIVMPSRTEADARREVGMRIIRRLAQVTLSRIVALDDKATELQQRKAYLAARLRLLKLTRDGAQGIVEDGASTGDEIKALERELKDTVDGYIEAKAGIATLDAYIGQIDAVFGSPGEYVSLTHTPLRVSRMGIKLEETSSEAANELVLPELSIGENFRVA